jgi:outer membrane autotransporter protein
LLPGSRILGEILLGTNDTVNIDIGSRLSSVLTLNFGDATGAHGLSGTGAVVNVVTTELSVVHGNEIATLEPTALALTDRTLLDFTGGVSSLIQGRLGEVADPAGTVFAGGGSSLVTSYAAAPGANPNLPTKKAPTTAPSPLQTIVVWANAFGGGHVQASDGPDLRATHSYGGVAFGLDAQALPNLRLGAFLGGGFGQLAVAQGSQHIDTDYITGGIYGHYSFGAPFLDFNLFGGTTHNNSTRLVNSLGTGGLETATGSYGGSFVSPELALGWRIEDLGNGLVWTPAARLRYVAGWFDRYAETGSTQNLVVNSRSLQDVEGRLELAVSKALPFGDGLIGLQAKAGVIGLTRLGSTSTEVNLIGADFSFPTPGRNQDFGAYAGLGVDYKVTATISAFASAEGTVLTHSSRYGTARAGFQVKFW